MSETPKEVKELALYAWLGEDELGSGEIGLKQGIVPAGTIPLVATKQAKMTPLQNQMQLQADHYGKPIRLCKFVFQEEIKIIKPT